MDSVIEMVVVENFDADCRAVKKYGTIVVLGAGTGKNPVGSVKLSAVLFKDIDVRGLSLFNSDPVFPEMIRQLNLMLADGRVRASVGETMPLADAPRSHDRADDRAGLWKNRPHDGRLAASSRSPGEPT